MLSMAHFEGNKYVCAATITLANKSSHSKLRLPEQPPEERCLPQNTGTSSSTHTSIQLI